MSDFHRGTRRFDDVEAASFSLDDTDLTVTEDGGDRVAKDTAGNVVLRYDEAARDWVMGSLNTDNLLNRYSYQVVDSREITTIQTVDETFSNISISKYSTTEYALAFSIIGDQGASNVKVQFDGNSDTNYAYKVISGTTISNTSGASALQVGQTTFNGATSSLLSITQPRNRVLVSALQQSGQVTDDDIFLWGKCGANIGALDSVRLFTDGDVSFAKIWLLKNDLRS